MTTCPNCGKRINDLDEKCSYCGFDLKRYRETHLANSDKPHTQNVGMSRAAYRKEFKPEKPNSTVQNMIDWIRKNATIVFLLGIFLLIITSFSTIWGWITFFVLMIWLFIVCNQKDKIDRYVADQKLTAKMNQIGSNAVNSINTEGRKLKDRREKFNSEHPKIEQRHEEFRKTRNIRYTYVQISIIFMALVSLIIMFYGSGSGTIDNIYTQRVSISKVLLGLGRNLLGSDQTILSALIVYLVWLILILIPIFIVFNTFKNTLRSHRTVFFLSLIETILVGYIIYHLSNSLRASTGIFSRLTSQLVMYAASIGTSIYFLIFTSLITTVLSGYNLFNKKGK